MKHTLELYSSFRGFTIEVNGARMNAGASGHGRARCSCGWDSGTVASGDAANAAFEAHEKEARTAKRRRARP